MPYVNPGFAVNGRFLQKRITGVQRYAREIVARFDGGVEVITAGRAGQGALGHVWEQTTLHARTANRLLWSPCNSGPVCKRNQVVTIHDVAYFDTPECFSPRYVAWYKWMIPRLARTVRFVITVSKFSKSRIVEVCSVPESRVRVIGNGVDPRFVRPDEEQVRETRRRLGLEGDYILAVGSVEPRKNLPGLLKAWERLQPRLRGVSLAIAGATGISCFSEAALQTDCPGVRWLGFVDDVNLPALYGGALAFVFPSLYEGFGLPPLEAAACGTPVVCSRSTSLPEVMGDAAVYVDPLDPESIALGIQRAIEDTTLQRELRQRGPERARLFRWDQAARETFALLGEAAVG